MIFKKNQKQKSQEEGIQITSLSHKEHEYTRPLWELTFDEDSEEFVDFYYTNKVTNNSIWVAKEDDLILSMAQLNPYQLHLGKSIVYVHYIVGVATHEEYRRQGLMRSILEAALLHLYENKEPFTYLMPAKEEYYTGFDFLSVYYQKKGVLVNGVEDTSLTVKTACADDYEELARFSKAVLSSRYQVFVQRDPYYYEMVQAQFEAEHGGIKCVYQDNVIVGYFFYGEYETIEVMEPVCLEAFQAEFTKAMRMIFKESGKEICVTAFDYLNEDDFKNIVTRPATMVRIICLETFVKYLRTTEPVTLTIAVEDEIIKQNNGVFEISISDHDANIQSTAKEPEISLTIRDLCAICFFHQIPKEVDDAADLSTIAKISKIKKYTPVFLNDFV